MKFQTTLLVMLAVLAAATTSRGQQFGPSAAGNMMAWYGPPAVPEDPSSAPAAGMPMSAGGDCGCYDPCYAEDLYCYDGSCGDCRGCLCEYNIWASAEFLVWWAKGSRLPPLVTTSAPAQAGILGPGTTILFGDDVVGDKVQAGGRFSAGIWLDPDHCNAAGGRFFFLGGDETNFSANSNQYPVLAEPFNDAVFNPPVPNAFLLGFPGVATGSVSAKYSNQNVFGAEAFTTMMMERDCRRRIDILFGYQFLRLDDSLILNSTQEIIDPGNLFFGRVLTFQDRFIARNEFHGVEGGVKGYMAHGCWALDGLAKLGVGNMAQRVTIAGTRTATQPNLPTITEPRGLYAQPSNSGDYQRNKLAVIPELTLNLKYFVSPCFCFNFGYNLIWLTDVATSGEQIDVNVNQQQLSTGPALPAFTFHTQDYWLMGMNFGMSCDF